MSFVCNALTSRLAFATCSFVLFSFQGQAMAQSALGLTHSPKRPVTDASLHKLLPPEVRHLSVSSDKVTDKGLASIGSFEDLLTLHLRRVRVTDKGLLHLSPLKNLWALKISGSSDLTNKGLKNLSALSSLKILTYPGPVNGSGLRHLQKLKQLQTLSVTIGKQDGSEFSTIAGLPDLTSLTITGARLNEELVQQIASRPLAVLTLNRCQLSKDSLKGLVGCHTLRALHLRSIPLSDSELSHVAQVSELRFLTLYETSISGRGTSKLTKLQHLKFLNLSRSKNVDDNILATVTGFKKLEELHLDGTSVSAAAGDRIRDSLPDAIIQHAASR